MSVAAHQAEPTSVLVSHNNTESRPQKNSAMISVNTNTASAVCVVSCFVGQMTLRISTREPRTNTRRRLPYVLVIAMPRPAARPPSTSNALSGNASSR